MTGFAPKITHIQDKLLINGEFVPALSGKTTPILNPATEEVIANVASAGVEDIELAVKAAREAFNKYRLTDGAYRRDLMLKLADLVHAHREELAALESLNNGKPYNEALNAEVHLTEQCFRFYAGFADKIFGDVAPVSGNNISMVKRQPIGVCGQIVPWNFPLLMASLKLGPALVMGNTVILKPAGVTPLSVLRLGELILEAGYPKGTVNIVPGSGALIGAALTGHPGVDKVAFTGSTEVGKGIMKTAAETNLKKVSLELGGKSALIVAEDADVDAAVGVAVTGIFFNMGQVCAASSRMYVHENLHDEFVAKLKAKADALRVGPGCDLSYNMGPLVSKAQLQIVTEYIQSGKDEGATLLTGGNRLGNKGYFMSPTVFCDVKPHMRICKEEIFGPVVCVMKFKDMEDAVAQANDSPYGLAAGICTKDLNTALRYSTFLDAGTVWVNTWNNFDVAQPFGGFKESGIGRELGKDAIELYSQPKSILIALNGPIVKP